MTFALSGVASQAHDVSLTDRFAECTGRLSAEMEHAWLIGDPRADLLETQRNHMASLLDAVSQPDRQRRALAHRIEAKMAHAELITLAYFSTDTVYARRAAIRAETLVLTCTAMLLS